MHSRDSRSVYKARMHRVLDHIDRYLDTPLDLATLAEVAHFSPFHFHRLFAAWIGETLGDYLRRRRVEVAAMRLVSQPRLSVLTAAIAVGFGSGEAFSRAFKTRFGCSPTAWREQTRSRRAKSNPGQADSNHDQAALPQALQHDVSANIPTETTMNVTLVDRPPALIAYLRYTGPYGESIAQFWQQTVFPWLRENSLLGQPRYGISHDDPSITEAGRCRYDACVEVPANFASQNGGLTATIPGGRYAILHFKGTAEEIGAAWDSLLRDWLASSGLQLDARPCFEYYPRDSCHDPQTGIFGCDICIPVAPL